MLKLKRERIVAALFLVLPGYACAAVSVEQEINQLLNFVATSSCAFIRNGDTHQGAAASKHMQKKYRHFAAEVETAEDFIRYSATKSLFSGKPYRVQCPGQEPALTANWLNAELARMRQGSSDD